MTAQATWRPSGWAPAPIEPTAASPAVLVTDADGKEHEAVALSPVQTKGHDFPVIWIRLRDRKDRIPWPAEAVRPDRPVVVTAAPYLIEGWAYRWRPEPGKAPAAVRVAYAIRDQWGWAVMARRGHRVVTIRRVEDARYGSASVARSLACVEVEHQAANWRRPTGGVS